jgi:heat shock protein HslJ
MNTRRWLLFAMGLALALPGCGGPHVNVVGTGSDSVRATVTYREPEALPPDAELNVWIADASTTTAATASATAPIAEGTLPMRERDTVFELRYDDDRIVEDHTYVLKASLRRGDETIYATDADTLVITRGHSNRASLVLRPIFKTPTSSVAPGAAAVGTPSLSGSSWRLENVAGTPAVAGIDATLEFGDGDRVSGNASCNKFSGTVKITGNLVAFGPLAATRMACASGLANAQEAAYLKALTDAERFVVDGTTLQIFSRGQASPLRFTRRP